MIVDIDLSPLTVMVIDDSRYARSFMKSALQSFGVRTILEAGDGPTALQILADNKVDLMLVDHDMDPMDGVMLTRFIREGHVPSCKTTPIIMVSGFAEMEKVMDARNAGVNEFLVKPVSADSMFRRIRNALINPRPFVDVASYTGPCRRSVERDMPDGGNRRRNPPLPKPPPLIALPPGVAQQTIRQAVAQGQSAAPGASEKTSRRRFAAGEVIFSEGEAGNEAYVIESGRVIIFKDVDGQKVALGELGASGVFGEMALIDDEPRMASAEAAAPTVCLVLPKATLKAQLNRTPDLVILVVETLLHDIRKMGRELVEARARLKHKRGG
ncbi:cyclic nucleotide-binding domain-containing protein [Magnetospirillum moscoviense]|uniref:Two-component system response regulator n=1 Tax=Magnetospirillum moscoviense TaxID=1437059 RepID=A0A178MXT5_9PROT|nr:cyclic nucleotide-binding domain-containing protein [Magnetospirillum moscoviense]MBF0324698.1 response regulator [Alphaproteobacteria bacterium]OAN54252.1 two-component system response regulator [Magnetospirillum moscoviense]